MPALEHTVSLPARYRVTRRIAAGGMATVHAAEDTLLGRLVAVKVVGPALADDPDARARFEREARAAARLSDHPHVVTIYDIGEHDGRPFIVMEYLPGGTVADRLRAPEPVPRPTALRWLEETASALDHAHRSGIVHRDVKPANLLLDGQGRLAVGDFGIARMAAEAQITATGQMLGTAAYLAPEQALGSPATPASDRYSLGVVAFELLTGRRPFAAEHPAAQARAHAEAEPPAASAVAGDLDGAVDRVLWRALAKEPGERWPTAGAMVAGLGDALDDQAEPATAVTAPIAARRPTPPARPRAAAAPRPPARRHRLAPWLALALLAVAIGAGVAAATAGGGPAASAPASHHRAAARVHRAVSRHRGSVTTTPTPATATDRASLQAQAHALIQQGQLSQAIELLRTRVVPGCPVSQTDPCAFALFDLGHALRIDGQPQAAIPYLRERLLNPTSTPIVENELRLAEQEAGQTPAPPATPSPAPPGQATPPGHGPKGDHGHGHGNGGGDGGGG